MSEYIYLLLANFDRFDRSKHTKKIIGTFDSFDKAEAVQKKLCPTLLRASYRINYNSRLKTWIIRIPIAPQGVVEYAIDIHTSVIT